MKEKSERGKSERGKISGRKVQWEKSRGENSGEEFREKSAGVKADWMMMKSDDVFTSFSVANSG